MTKEIKSLYEKNGYYIAKSVFSKDFIQKLLDYLQTLSSKVTLPFTNVPWGYGNLLGSGPFAQVSDNNVIKDFCTDMLGVEYIFNHLFVHNKVPWIGASIEWHQEVFNIDSYAPGYSKNEWNKFMQIYVALEKQDIENGCIKVFPRSHEEGELPCEDVVNEHFSHKRKVPFEILQTIYNKYGIMNCELDPGDVLFFNHLIVHGSASNASHKSRKAIVLQARSNIREKDITIFNKETSYRTDFVTLSLQKRIDELNSKNIYKDMNKG